jgi:hypothetical protein
MTTPSPNSSGGIDTARMYASAMSRRALSRRALDAAPFRDAYAATQ